MNEPLDLVGKIRDSVDGPTADVTARHRQQLMALADRRRNLPRRRRRVVTGGVVAVLALTGVAAAAGLVPTGVSGRFGSLEERSQHSVDVDSDSAQLVAEAAAGDDRVELWLAPTKDHETCLYIRSVWHLDREPPTENGPIGCSDEWWPSMDGSGATPLGVNHPLGFLDVFPLGHPTNGYEPRPSLATAFAGVVDVTVASVDIEFRDGQHYRVDVTDPDGWFAAIVDDDFTRPSDRGVFANPAMSVTLRDRDDVVLATLTEWHNLHPVATEE